MRGRANQSHKGFAVEQRRPEELAGTPRTFRKLEWLAAMFFPVFWLALFLELEDALLERPLVIPLIVTTGMLLADFLSGVLHWGCDTWGSLETPVIGRTVIRTFREHHVDQTAIVRHDFIETNASNMLASLSVIAVAGCVLDWGVFVSGTLLSTATFLSATSQIHKWAHMPDPPRAIRFLQRSRLILSADHHAVHHAAPFEKHYCITNGWLNEALAYVRFFRTLERIITLLTGALPRQDDIGNDAALSVAKTEGVAPPAQTKHAKRTS